MPTDYNAQYKRKRHLERSAAESKDLRTLLTVNLNQMPRSLRYGRDDASKGCVFDIVLRSKTPALSIVNYPLSIRATTR